MLRQIHNIIFYALVAGLAAFPASGSERPSFYVYFKPDSTPWDETEHAIKAAVGLYQAICSDQVLYLYSRTDTVGTAEENLASSVQNASIVAERLKAYGIAEHLIVQRPLGETDLQIATPDETPEVLNRFVDIAFGERADFADCDFTR